MGFAPLSRKLDFLRQFDREINDADFKSFEKKAVIDVNVRIQPMMAVV